ncbi:uncharacterized protein LOC134265604 [Saccostrea cucullata]|uniref:uncharacterized protein LOC134265604 n=1 Tax=Saccostrea cuccullata TaxID=36930 RepID=UPI002ED4A843
MVENTSITQKEESRKGKRDPQQPAMEERVAGPQTEEDHTLKKRTTQGRRGPPKEEEDHIMKKRTTQRRRGPHTEEEDHTKKKTTTQRRRSKFYCCQPWTKETRTTDPYIVKGLEKYLTCQEELDTR